MAIPQDTELSGKGTHFRMPLSTEQLLLLNNLMYMTAEEPLRSITAETYQGRTVRTMIESIDIKRFDEGKNYGSYMTGTDWQQILRSIQKDERHLRKPMWIQVWAAEAV